jgi:hypothetical protein
MSTGNGDLGLSANEIRRDREGEVVEAVGAMSSWVMTRLSTLP